MSVYIKYKQCYEDKVGISMTDVTGRVSVEVATDEWRCCWLFGCGSFRVSITRVHTAESFAMILPRVFSIRTIKETFVLAD